MGQLVLSIIRVTSLLIVALSFLTSSHAFPLLSNTLQPRSFIISNATGTPEVINTNTGEFVTQSVATDGSGHGFDISAVIWIAFCFVFGAPMALAGIWGLRLRIAVTRGIALGLVFAICSWSALTNTLSSTPPVPDIVLTTATLGFCALGCFLGLLNFTKHLARIALGILGGLSLGIRVVLLRQDLLFGAVTWEYIANWILVAVMGLLGGMVLFWERCIRFGLAFACASTGCFLTFLGIDLIMNRQTGMSTGLRFLFDRNAAHLIDIMQRGYKPPFSTIIILATSLGLTPILAYVQYRFFTPPPSATATFDSEKGSILESPEDTLLRPPQMNTLQKERRSFITELWDAARFKGVSPHRFSL